MNEEIPSKSAIMKTNAAEYFSSLSPLKAAAATPGVSPYESRTHHNGRSGRCHCCPYGYHIDLDFVRYCDMLTQGSKNDSPTLRQLKKLKRARRRQTKSMEVLLGLATGKENEVPQHQEKLEIIEEPFNSDSMDRGLPSKSRRMISTWQERTPPPLPLRQSNNFVKSPSEVVSAKLNQSANSSNSNRNANDALQEAVLDFEEMFENSQDVRRNKGRSETLPPDISTYDISYQHYPPSLKQGTSLGRSHSLPRQFLEESSLLQRRQRTSSASSLSSVISVVDQAAGASVSAINGVSSGLSGYAAPSSVGIIQQHPGPRHLSEALAALSTAQGYPVPQPDFDAMSVTSAMSGVSTSTLQSIRDQMAVSLSRLKELEEEVKTIPMLQIKLNVLKEEKRLLVRQLKSIQKGEEAAFLLPPSLDGDLSDMSEDELEGRLAHLRHTSLGLSRNRRRRSESPLRVNLEEFHSYRRARRGSVSEGSEADSVTEEFPLFIKEGNDSISERKSNRDHITERRSSLMQNQSLEGRLSHSMPSTPLVGRKHLRDAATSCRVITRDIGITHIGTRTRSIGIATDKIEIDKKREIKAKPCMQCYERNKKTYDSKGVGTPSLSKLRPRSLSMSSVSLESFDPDDVDVDLNEVLDKDGNSKNAFLQRLGRKSGLISRLSEPQLAPPVLTFDNSTNTDHIRHRDQRMNTSLFMSEIYTRVDLKQHLANAKEEWETKQHDRLTKAKADWEAKQYELITKARRDWEAEQKEYIVSAKQKWETEHREAIVKLKTDMEAKHKESLDRAKRELVAVEREHIERAKIDWETKEAEHIRQARIEWEWKEKENIERARAEWEERQKILVTATSEKLSKPFTSNLGIQVSLDDPSLRKSSFKPLVQSIGVMVKPTSVNIGVGKSKISEKLCEKCANIHTRSVAVGESSINDILCDNCVTVKMRSVGVGDSKLSDILCEKCSTLQTRTVGCSNDKISDMYCERCDNIRMRTVASGSSLPMSKIVDDVCKPKANAYAQTKSIETRTASVNTVPLNIKKDELSSEASGPPSPALTPEVERRSYGSSGVRICDKCHETIHSVAKDIVNTSGTASATNLPPIPPQMSKIPRLVDLAKVEPRLDIPITSDIKASKNVPMSLESSLTESQLSSMSSSFLDVKSTALTSNSFRRSEDLGDKSAKTEALSCLMQEPLALKESQRHGITSSKRPSEATLSSDLKEGRSTITLKMTVNNEKPGLKSTQPSGLTTSGTTLKVSSGFSTTGTSPQTKRVPYTRQQTYTKLSEGLDNLGFDENVEGDNLQKARSDKTPETIPEVLPSSENIAAKASSVLRKKKKVPTATLR